MATLDDKLLGEKMQNYCSSSSEDDEEPDEKETTKANDEDNREREKSKSVKGPKFISDAEATAMENSNWSGAAQNTGPKGVIKDWQRYKQLEREKSMEMKKERDQLIKKLAMTCRSDDIKDEVNNLNKEQQQAAAASKKSNKDDEISMEELEKDLMEDEFFQEYLKKKYEEMKRRTLALPRFGKVIELKNDKFLDEIDKENKNITIIVHIYDPKMSECKIMNDCLDSIANDYNFVKFCRIKSTEIDLSDKFRKMGCPALLIYKNAELIGNFVRMGDEFGSEFCASDVENFLLEQSFLPPQEIVGSIRDGIAMPTNSQTN